MPATGIDIRGPMEGRVDELLTPDALAFLSDLHRRFEPTRRRLLQARTGRQQGLDRGTRPDFLPETRSIRDGSWHVPPAPADLSDRRVEITGPTDRKMMINALNSGARVFMADFEDANAPTWDNLTQGQLNVTDAVERTIRHENPDGRVYELRARTATLVVRPRGLHLPERHVRVDGEAIAGSFFDFGLFLYHNARRLQRQGSGPYLYLPKLESHLEARLWNDVCTHTEETLAIPRGSIRATVLIETILAAFEMEEILHELQEHAGGLNAGRWDYIFSVIKKFRNHRDLVLPDRAQVTMTVPFMRAYTRLLVATAHRRGAFAIGGMAAFIPNRRDAEVTEAALEKVRQDKVREAGDGFDGTWVAHPDLVPVALEVFDKALGDGPNQLGRVPEGTVRAADLLDVRVPDGRVTEEGLRTNVSVGLQYLEAWLGGTGAVALNNLMEDAATAEISRAQLWQWSRHNVRLPDGRPVTRELVRDLIADEARRLETGLEPQQRRQRRFAAARQILTEVATEAEFREFLTIPAYEILEPRVPEVPR